MVSCYDARVKNIIRQEIVLLTRETTLIHNKEVNIRMFSKKIKKNWELYLLMLPVVIYFIIFHYYPMYGIQIAFKDFVPSLGYSGSEWVGFKHFKTFFNSYDFWRLLKNTLGISFYQLIAGFPAPIILAIMLNEIRRKKYKKFMQTITYAPHFISTVTIAGIMTIFLSPDSGIINFVIRAFGGESVDFLGKAEWFKTIFVTSNIWQNAGWGSIIYLASLTSIDTALYEAAAIDGCNKFKRIWNIDIPGILPTAIILLTMNLGRIMNVGFQKILLLQNSLNISSSDVIQAYVYRMGLENAQFSLSTAVGLFNNIINLILLISFNKFAKKAFKESLW